MAYVASLESVFISPEAGYQMTLCLKEKGNSQDLFGCDSSQGNEMKVFSPAAWLLEMPSFSSEEGRLVSSVFCLRGRGVRGQDDSSAPAVVAGHGSRRSSCWHWPPFRRARVFPLETGSLWLHLGTRQFLHAGVGGPQHHR